MKRQLLWIVPALATACASSGGEARPPAAQGSPIVMYAVRDRNAPHPTLRIPAETAREMGVWEESFATTAMIDRLVASCADSTRPADCRRELAPCREKTCRIVPFEP